MTRPWYIEQLSVAEERLMQAATVPPGDLTAQVEVLIQTIETLLTVVQILIVDGHGHHECHEKETK